MTSIEKKDYMVALKVMRLTRPTFGSPAIITSETADVPKDLFSNILTSDAHSLNGVDSLPPCQLLLLPQSFGTIYLGETFSCYICVHNSSSHPVQGIKVKTDLQSDKSRIILPIHENRKVPSTLYPNDTLDDVIHHEVKEIGVHILVCEVSYITPAGLDEKFRKFFKFGVVKPLDVKTKFYNAEMDEIYLEAYIQNITSAPISLENVLFETSGHYSIQSLNAVEHGESVFKSKNMLQPLNSCQFLYCIKPLATVAKDSKVLQMAEIIGKLDIVWRSNLGERSRLQTSQLQRSPVEHGDIRLIVIEAKSTVTLGVPFTFTSRIINNSEQNIDLEISLNTKQKPLSGYTSSSEFKRLCVQRAVVCATTMIAKLGTIAPNKSADFKLTVCPIKMGLMSISHLKVIDVALKRTYEFEDFLLVFVVDNTNKIE